MEWMRWRVCSALLCVAITVSIHVISVYAAPTEQTKAPKVVKCWECQNYDAQGNFYSQCPMNDTVDPIKAYIGNCTGSCFTHTDDRDHKLVVRGCTTSQWGLPDPLPDDGCYPWYSEVWCVCSTNGCNGVALGVPGKKQFDYQVDYSKPKADDSSNEATNARCLTHHLHWTLLLLFVVYLWM